MFIAERITADEFFRGGQTRGLACGVVAVARGGVRVGALRRPWIPGGGRARRPRSLVPLPRRAVPDAGVAVAHLAPRAERSASTTPRSWGADMETLTVFRSRLRDDVPADYDTLADDLEARARSFPGFVEFKMFFAADGERLALVTFAIRRRRSRLARRPAAPRRPTARPRRVLRPVRRGRLLGAATPHLAVGRLTPGACEDASVLFLHETHQVAGYHEDAFEARVPPRLDAHAGRRRRRPPPLVPEPRPRQRRGRTTSSPSPRCVTARRGSACAGASSQGDLQDWMRELDTFRHDVRGKVLRHAAVVARVGPRPRGGARRRHRARSRRLHGRHDVAVRGQVPRVHRRVGQRLRGLARAPRLRRPALPRDRSRIPTRIRLAHEARGRSSCSGSSTPTACSAS